MAWTFGEAALPETERYAAVVRELSSLVLQLERPEPRVAELIAELEAARTDLVSLVPPDPRPRVGAAIDTDGRVYLDHSRHVGAFNPTVPTYAIRVDGDEAAGTVTFPVLYEGPPGVVHGGFLAVFFDAVIQHHSCDVGVAGKTTRLELRFHAPTPLLTELRFTISRAVDAHRIESTADLFAGDLLCCSATMRAVAGDQAALPAVSPRKAP